MKKLKASACLSGSVFVFLVMAHQNAMALDPIKIGDVDVGTITGYARIGATWNLEDHPEPDGFGKKIGGKGDLSMLRSTLQLQYVNSNLPSFLPEGSSVTVIGRLFKEKKTSYLDKLDEVPTQVGHLMNNYNSNRESFREAYIDLPISQRFNLRFGKQQVIWGETDLLQALDIINPRDVSWNAPGLEPEDEDLRQPLIMANLTMLVPEWDGSLQLLYRPGWDNESQLGTTLDLFGGRFAAQPTKGVNLGMLLPYNYHHKGGDTDDASYGFRWSGKAGVSNIGYSLNYYHSVDSTPVLNVSIPGVITPYKGAISPKSFTGFIPGGGAELILPEFDLYGGTINAYIKPLDIVLRSEIGYTPDKLYNSGSVKAMASGTLLEKDTLKFMIGFDKQFAWMDILGTDSASFWTVQIFDSWITDFKKKDALVDGPGSVAPLEEHSVTVVTTLGLSYNDNQVQPSIALVGSPTYGSAAVIPSVNLLFGNHWRLLLNAAFFFPSWLDGCSTKPSGQGASCTHGFAAFDNNNQFGARLTYQF